MDNGPLLRFHFNERLTRFYTSKIVFVVKINEDNFVYEFCVLFRFGSKKRWKHREKIRFFLRQLKNFDSNWPYYDQISATNNRWKNEITDDFFHLLKILSDSLWRRLAMEIFLNEIPSNSSLDVLLADFFIRFRSVRSQIFFLMNKIQMKIPWRWLSMAIQMTKRIESNKIKAEQINFVVKVPPITNSFDFPIENKRLQRMFYVFIEILENF